MRSLLKRQNVSKVQICWPPLSLQHWSGPSHKKAAPPPSSVPWDPNLRFTNELADTKGPTHRAQQFYTPFMFGQMYVPVSMLTRIGNTLKDTNTHTDSNWPPNKSEQFYTPFMIGQIPWAANLLFLMTLTLMCDPRSENELFSLKLLKGLDLHISVDWWQHIHTQTKIHGVLGLTYHIFISSSHSNMRIRLDKYKYTHTPIHTNMHTQTHYKAYIKRLSEARPALWAILDPDWTDRRSPQNPASFLLKHFLHTGRSKLVCKFLHVCI